MANRYRLKMDTPSTDRARLAWLLLQKWLTRIWVRDKMHDGAKMTGSSYRMPETPTAPGVPIPEDRLQIIESMPVKSLITSVKTGAQKPAERPFEVRGHAWSGETPVAALMFQSTSAPPGRQRNWIRLKTLMRHNGGALKLSYRRKGITKSGPALGTPKAACSQRRRPVGIKKATSTTCNTVLPCLRFDRRIHDGSTDFPSFFLSGRRFFDDAALFEHHGKIVCRSTIG